MLRKIPIFLIFILLSSAGCTPSGGAPDFSGPAAEAPDANIAAPAVDEQLAAEAGLKRIVYHVGPVDLPAGTPPDAMLEQPLAMRFQTDEPLWVIAFTPRVVNANGDELPAKLLHHALMLNMHEDNPLCADAGGGNPFFIATGMLTEIELPQGTGYAVLPDDPIEARVVLENSTDESFVEVFFEMEIVARPMNEFTQLADVKPMLLEFDSCGHEPMEVQPGELAERNATFELPHAARLVLANGALQNFGSTIQLTAGLEVSPFWRAEAELTDAHELVDLRNDPFEDPAGLDFGEGDRITLGVVYDNVSDRWLNDATAAAMLYLSLED